MRARLRDATHLLAGFLAALLLAAVPAHAQTAPKPQPWAHEASDIAPDPAVRFGSLPNGMRYALMRNQLPPEAVSIRLSFRFGSLEEAESEKGLAHFIEHMAFNGSRHVPEGEMVKILERLGLTFGADTNASTGQKFTTYQLDLPKASDELVDESLFLLRETASELTFEAGAIDRERGVVLSEWRRGDNFQRRRNDQQLRFLLPGALAVDRMPIGDAEVIETAGREALVSLYDRYYRPERATLLMVGDFDIDAMERKIVAKFGGWAGRGEAGEDPDLSYKPQARPSAASAFVHKDGGDSIAVYSLGPYHDEPDTAAQRRLDNLLMFGIGALGRRLAPLANADDPPFRSAGVTASDILETVDAAAGSVTLTPDSWLPGVEALEQEWRRALLYGFTKDEIERQVEALRTSQENQAQRETTRTTGSLMSALLSTVQNDTVFATPSSGLKRLETWAGGVTPDVVLAEFRKHASVRDPLFFIASTAEHPGIEADVVAAWKASEATPVTPPPSGARLKFAYTDFGKPGKVVADRRLADIDTRLVTFENNVRLNIKHTDFVKNSVRVSVRVANGNLDFPDEPFGLSSLMRAFSGGGLEKHSIDDLRTILQGRQVSTRFGGTGTSFGSAYSTTPEDLELQLELAAAYVTHPGYRPEAERRWRQSQVLSWPRLDQNAQTVWAAKGMRILMAGDKRFGADPDDGAAFRSFVELRHYLTPTLEQGAIEVAIVGDISEDEAIRLVAKTFGALPAREPMPTKFRFDRPAVFRPDKSPIVLTHAGEASQALVQVFWPVTDIDPDADQQAARTLVIMAGIMRLKVTDEVREVLGATYSPTAGASLSSNYEGFGYVSAGAEVKPEDADRVTAALRKIAAEMRAGEISDDEFSRAITPSLEALPQNAVSNSYWLSLIAQAQSRPEITERAKLLAIEASVRAVTKADVVAAAQKYLVDAALQETRVMPGPKASTD
jgi:zinc protease